MPRTMKFKFSSIFRKCDSATGIAEVKTVLWCFSLDGSLKIIFCRRRGSRACKTVTMNANFITVLLINLKFIHCFEDIIIKAFIARFLDRTFCCKDRYFGQILINKKVWRAPFSFYRRFSRALLPRRLKATIFDINWIPCSQNEIQIKHFRFNMRNAF